jgi:hypothetical protein
MFFKIGVLRTTSPYSMVRRVEEWVAPKDVDLFNGTVVFYKGKRWNKEEIQDR